MTRKPTTNDETKTRVLWILTIVMFQSQINLAESLRLDGLYNEQQFFPMNDFHVFIVTDQLWKWMSIGNVKKAKEFEENQSKELPSIEKKDVSWKCIWHWHLQLFIDQIEWNSFYLWNWINKSNWVVWSNRSDAILSPLEMMISQGKGREGNNSWHRRLIVERWYHQSTTTTPDRYMPAIMRECWSWLVCIDHVIDRFSSRNEQTIQQSIRVVVVPWRINYYFDWMNVVLGQCLLTL